MPHLFTSYQPFVDRVRRLMGSKSDPCWQNESTCALNGLAGKELESLVPLDLRRAVGAFFTTHTLADALLKGVSLDSKSRIYDPTCGAGDLLLAATRKLEHLECARGTLKLWKSQLIGTDIVSEFLETCALRLQLQARFVHDGEMPVGSGTAVHIEQIDALHESKFFKMATHVLMNPPFTLREAPIDCSWASGLVNAAAIFMEHAVRHVVEGSMICAILPEVLRTGSRYAGWRDLIANQTDVIKIQSAGLFPGCADVDVFIFHAVRRPSESTSRVSPWIAMANSSSGHSTIDEHFKVSVGPVVDYRDPLEGPLCRFAHPKNIPSWKHVSILKGRRRWTGRMEKPPFVVIRRTSRPGDKYRATGSIILGTTPVAVENHLLIIRPNDGTLEQCKKLLSSLKTKETNEFLDSAMRCRHLTVGVVRRIPLNSEFSIRSFE